MFIKRYGDVVLSVKEDVPKRGRVLCAEKQDADVEIFMDFCGESLRDGSDGYMFGNRIFVVTRWADMDDAERAAALSAELSLVFAPLRFMQAAMRVGDYDWSDITFSLYHCMRFLNDETKPVESVVFLFCDQLSGEIVAEREVVLPAQLQAFLRTAFLRSHESAVLDMNYGAYLEQAQESETQDFCDILYNKLADLSEEDVRTFREADPLKIPLGVYVTVDGENRVADFYQNKQ